ncbi:hypothetical protein ACWOKM_003155 [Vibrio parahaemolyticus]
MTVFSPFTQKVLKALISGAVASYPHVSAHYQRVRREMSELSDFDLFEETKNHPVIHIRCVAASLELIQRGYSLSDIRDERNDP